MTVRIRPNTSLLLMSLLVAALLTSALVGTAAGQASVTVRITAALDPSVVTIEAGASVTWSNADDERHRMRSESGPVDFDTGNLEPGEVATITFTEPGAYDYFDHRDPDDHEHRGRVIVTAPGDAPTTPPPGGSGGGTNLPATTDATVTMAGRTFRPGSVSIAAGGTVTFLNDDDRAHTATANDRSWDSGVFDTGGSYRRTFPTAGSYAYFCVIHPDMRGMIVVGGGSTPAPPPTSPPTIAPPTGTQPPATPGSGTATPGALAVAIVDFDFSPRSITIAAGGRVTWRNDGAAPHTVTADSGAFDSGFMFTSDDYARSFPTPGTFSYFCTLHPEMRATVTVGSGGGGPAAPTTNPGTPSPPNTAPISGSPTTGSPTAALRSGAVDVAMLENRFGPASITVRAGSTVRWRNNGAALHTVTANDGSFDSGFAQPGQQYARRFATSGTYGYYCTIHPGMTGTVVVTDASGTAPPPSAVEPPVTAVLGGGPDDATAAAGDAVRVDMVDLAFEPRDLVVAPGTEVLWINVGLAPHTVAEVDGTVDSGLVMPGETFTRGFDQVGTFSYYCTLHPGMEGTVTVSETAALMSSGAAAVSDGSPPAERDEPAPVLATVGGISNGVGLAEGLSLAVGLAFVLAGWGAALWLAPGRPTGRPGPEPSLRRTDPASD